MELLKNKEFKLIFSNTSSQFLIRLITSLSTFTITLLITYLFGFSLFGSFTKIVAFVSFFYLIVDFGVNAIFLKDHLQDVEKLFFNLLILRLSIAFLLIIIIFLFSLILPYNNVTNIGFSPYEKLGVIIFSFTLFTQAFVFSLNSLFQKHLQFSLLVFPYLFSSVILLIIVSFGLILKDLYIILFAYFLSGLAFSTIAFLLIKKRFMMRFSLFGFKAFSKNLLVSSLPLGVMLIFNLVYFKVDALILSFYKVNLEVGVYGFSFKMFEFLIAIATFFSVSVYPILLKKEKESEDEFYNHVFKYAKALFVLSLIVLFFAFALSPLLALLKKDLALSIVPLRILSLSLPFFFLTSLFQWVLVIKNKKKYLLFIYFISVLLNIVLNLIFIPQYSYLASSVITIICEVIVFALMLFGIFRLRRGYFSRKTT